MTAIMSFGMLFFRTELNQTFFKRWAQDFLLGAAIAIPAGYVIVPLVQKMINKLTA
jgi:hypothetical protein